MLEALARAPLQSLKLRYHFNTLSRTTTTVSEECDLEDVAALLEDETVRTILTATSVEPMSASSLSERCGVSEPTIYRRLEDLRDCELVEERTEPDLDSGHHTKVYAPRLERLTVTLVEGQLDFELERRTETMADRFTDLVEQM
jgi:DNA-binding transcriptional ArsR family regulator